mmetsp:Transcript_8974/g.11020  ORF Transcript_8974/g.11020 Transcript_8974/m.11020 type:complete len:93 (+) Transcript_8974:334-612(+)
MLSPGEDGPAAKLVSEGEKEEESSLKLVDEGGGGSDCDPRDQNGMFVCAWRLERLEWRRVDLRSGGGKADVIRFVFYYWSNGRVGFYFCGWL